MIPTILQAIDDRHLFGAAETFRKTESWVAWRVFLKTLFGLPLSKSDLDRYRKCTGRSRPPAAGFNEAWLVIGRRGGKSFTLALIAVYLAAFKDWRPYLGPGEVGTVMVIAADRKQARTILRYAKGLLSAVPMLKQLITNETTESISLSNRIVIETHTASFRTVRGYTIVAALLDELAFWPTDEAAAEPDVEVINAIRPGMATVPGSMLLCASSPYAQRGALWDAHRRYFGRDDSDVLVWQAATRTMNPSVPQAFIDAEMEKDPAAAAGEYLAQFRTDVAAFVDRKIVEGCVVTNRHELPYATGARYHAFVDPSGGSADSMTLAIAHRDRDGMAVLDAIRERRPPFSPESVVNEFCGVLNAYKIHRVVGDRYAGEWPRERFRAQGVHYEPSEKAKSDLYVDLLPLLNSGRIELLDHPRLVTQFCGLERKTARSGKDSIDHQAGGHDDLANAAAGVAVAVAQKRGGLSITPEVLALSKIPTRRIGGSRFAGRRPMKVFFR